MEDGTATGELLELMSDNAIAQNSDTDTINAFTLFDEKPVYTSAVSVPTANQGLVQSCLKNHIVIISDGVSRTSANGLTPNGFSPDNPGSILASWNDNIVDSAVASPAWVTDFVDVAAALNDTDLLGDDEFHNNITTYIFGMQPTPEDTTYYAEAADAGGGLYFGVPGSFFPWRQVMVDSLAAIIADIRAQGTAITGTAAKPVFSTDSLESGTNMYQSRFSTVGWFGSLQAYDLDDNTGALQTPALWEASAQLPTPSNRQIFTMGSGGSAVSLISGNVASLTATQQADLAEVPPSSGYSAANAIDYLRGDQSLEGVQTTDFRARPRSLLGDFVHSAPVHSGAPNMNYSDANYPDYSTFKAAQTARQRMVYIGANDGMLHAFNASTGVEEWAYIPQAMFVSGEGAANDEGLSALLQSNFNNDHRYYVDGTPVVVDVFFDHDSSGTATWRTVLIASFRGGARGLFALDVTDPVPISGGVVDFSALLLWEISGSDLATFGHDYYGIGYIYGAPSVVKLADDEWGVVFGNGYNSETNKAALFVLNVKDGTLISSVEVESANAANNGMAEPKVIDLDGDGDADRIYAGDLLGNMWAFESYQSGGDTRWRSVYSNGAGPQALFSGGDPITSVPVVMEHPDTLNSPNLVVLFGTGKLLETTDLNTVVDSGVYGIFDIGTGGLTRTDLQARTLTTTGTLRELGDDSVTLDPVSSDGWYFDLDAGERSVTNPRLFRGVFFVSTMTPSDGECDLGGDSWLLTVDPVTGLAPDFAVLDTNQDGVRNDGDIGDIAAYLKGVTTSPAILSDRLYLPGTAKKGKAVEFELGSPSSGNTDMLTWEEIFRTW